MGEVEDNSTCLSGEVGNTMNWKIGDKAVIVRSVRLDRIGTHVTIMSNASHFDPHTGLRWNCTEPCYLVDLPHRCEDGGLAGYRGSSLRPIPDAYDGNEMTSWDECPWTPKVLEIIEIAAP